MALTEGNCGWTVDYSWWTGELAADPAYDEVVTPLLLDRLRAGSGDTVLDVGCGDGRVMTAVAESGAVVVGADLDSHLLGLAVTRGGVVRASATDLRAFRTSVFTSAYVCLVLEHVPDHAVVFGGLARVVEKGGVLAVVLNHPTFTAPDSGPIVDEDGETLWRPGEYFSRGWTDEPAGEGVIRFHHRTMGELLTAAAAAGWQLDELVEVGVTDAQIERTPWLADQRHVPRLLGCRWINHSGR